MAGATADGDMVVAGADTTVAAGADTADTMGAMATRVHGSTAIQVTATDTGDTAATTVRTTRDTAMHPRTSVVVATVIQITTSRFPVARLIPTRATTERVFTPRRLFTLPKS